MNTPLKVYNIAACDYFLLVQIFSYFFLIAEETRKLPGTSYKGTNPIHEGSAILT